MRERLLASVKSRILQVLTQVNDTHYIMLDVWFFLVEIGKFFKTFINIHSNLS